MGTCVAAWRTCMGHWVRALRGNVRSGLADMHGALGKGTHVIFEQQGGRYEQWTHE